MLTPNNSPSPGTTVAYHSSPHAVAAAGKTEPTSLVIAPFLNQLISVFCSLSPSGSK